MLTAKMRSFRNVSSWRTIICLTCSIKPHGPDCCWSILQRLSFGGRQALAHGEGGSRRSVSVGQSSRSFGGGPTSTYPSLLRSSSPLGTGDYEGWDHPNPTQLLIQKRQTFAKGSWGGEWHQDFVPQPGRRQRALGSKRVRQIPTSISSSNSAVSRTSLQSVC
jgi:hypothetical protein